MLIANSDRFARAWIETTVNTAGLCAIACDSARELLARVASVDPMCVILDVSLPDANGLDIQDRLTRAGAAIVFLTHERCIPTCVRAIQAGAIDFLTLPCEAARLVHALRNALQKALFTRAQIKLRDELRNRFERLTQRERQVFALVSSGMLNKQIADRLSITEFTVQAHRGRVVRKMRARSIADLVRMADAVKAISSICWPCD
ncbi:MAG: LuxR C-terminal-related transcriptional regulator [Pseudomonadota bacterium]